MSDRDDTRDTRNNTRESGSSNLLYCNKPPGCRGMIAINTLIYVVIRLNSEAPYVRTRKHTPPRGANGLLVRPTVKTPDSFSDKPDKPD